MRETWSADAVANAWRQVQAMGNTLEDMERSISKEDRNEMEQFEREMEREMNEFGEKRGPAYAKEAEAWIRSKSVAAVEAHKMVVANSKEFQHLAYDGMALGREFATGRFHAGEGFNADRSYSKFIDNDDARVIFEEIYQIKNDLKALVESKLAVEQRRLEMATLEEPQVAKLVGMFHEDFGSCEEIQARLAAVARRIRTELGNCPIAKRLARQVVQLMRFARKQRQLSDLPNEQAVRRWWNRKNFQPWE